MAELIDLIREYRADTKGGDRLWEEIIRVVGPALYLFLLSRAPGAADDVRQETLIAICLGLPQFRGETESEAWAWCYQIARNKLSRHFRDQDSDRFVSIEPAELDRLVEASASENPLGPDEKLCLEEALDLLRKSKPECFEVLWSRFILGLDYKEIAEAQGVNYDNARRKVERCLEHAQSLLE
jgi:RNA polymerase sigma factor (sigma-70 family)